MIGTNSVTVWLGDLKSGGDSGAAAQRLWERYWKKLVHRARLHLSMRAAEDEEDVALSAFDSFCRGMAAGRYPQLADRDDLWRLLIVITRRKARKQDASERRKKRGGGKVVHEAALAPDDGRAFDQLVGPDPTPDFAAAVAEEYTRLLDLLPDERLRQIAVAFMEGYNAREIAARFHRTREWVQGMKTRIRAIWALKVALHGAGSSGDVDEAPRGTGAEPGTPDQGEDALAP